MIMASLLSIIDALIHPLPYMTNDHITIKLPSSPSCA